MIYIAGSLFVNVLFIFALYFLLTKFDKLCWWGIRVVYRVVAMAQEADQILKAWNDEYYKSVDDTEAGDS